MAWVDGKLYCDRDYYIIPKILSHSKWTHDLLTWPSTLGCHVIEFTVLLIRNCMCGWVFRSRYYKTGIKASARLDSHLEIEKNCFQDHSCCQNSIPYEGLRSLSPHAFLAMWTPLSSSGRHWHIISFLSFKHLISFSATDWRKLSAVKGLTWLSQNTWIIFLI